MIIVTVIMIMRITKRMRQHLDHERLCLTYHQIFTNVMKATKPLIDIFLSHSMPLLFLLWQLNCFSIINFVDSLFNQTLLFLSTIFTHFLHQFQTGKLEENDTEIASLRHTAYTYSTLIASIQELRHLRDLDSGEKLDPRDKIRATGGRVGLGVPKVISSF